MIKMASGMAARANGSRGFMWAMLAIVAIGVPGAYWMSYVPHPLEFNALEIWLIANAVLVVVFAGICAMECDMENFDWKDIDRPLTLWALMPVWAKSEQPSWLRLFAWMLLIPAEIIATIAIRPFTLVIRKLLSPMPGGWD